MKPEFKIIIEQNKDGLTIETTPDNMPIGEVGYLLTNIVDQVKKLIEQANAKYPLGDPRRYDVYKLKVKDALL